MSPDSNRIFYRYNKNPPITNLPSIGSFLNSINSFFHIFITYHYIN